MNKKVWSDLSQEVQDEIISRILAGEKPYQIAPEYDLHPPSLSRKWRKLRRHYQEKSPRKKTESATTKANQFDLTSKERKVEPTYNVYQSIITPKFDVSIYGEDSSIPADRIMHIETKDTLTILFYTDTHFGEHDPVACDAFIRAAGEIPHDLIIHGGDALECYGLSRYGKNPDSMFKNRLKTELDAWYDFAENLNAASDAPKMMIFGNHMERYYNWLENQPAIYDIEDFQLDAIMRLKKYGYMPMVDAIYVDGEYDIDYPSSNIIFHHGALSRAHAGTSSRAESERRGYISSVSGHVHKLSTSYRRTLQQPVLYAEGGTLRNLHPTWMTFPDWQQGFLVIEYDLNNKYISGNTVNIVNGKARYCGTTI